MVKRWSVTRASHWGFFGLANGLGIQTRNPLVLCQCGKTPRGPCSTIVDVQFYFCLLVFWTALALAPQCAGPLGASVLPRKLLSWCPGDVCITFMSAPALLARALDHTLVIGHCCHWSDHRQFDFRIRDQTRPFPSFSPLCGYR